MPRQNRVTPYGELIAVPDRGMFWGNRGPLLDREGRLARYSRGQAWVICVLSFKGRRRQQWTPGRLTELYFLDEATGLAAGHRPCGECRYREYQAFKHAWARDAGKNVFYALDEAERDSLLKKIENEGKTKAKPSVTRFKGLGEMNPSQLRETTMDPRTRRLVQLTISAKDDSDQLMDMLLAKKRASDRRDWLEEKGNLAEVVP